MGNATVEWIAAAGAPSNFEPKAPAEGEIYKIELGDEQVRLQSHRCIVVLLDAYGNLIDDRSPTIRATLRRSPLPLPILASPNATNRTNNTASEYYEVSDESIEGLLLGTLVSGSVGGLATFPHLLVKRAGKYIVEFEVVSFVETDNKNVSGPVMTTMKLTVVHGRRNRMRILKQPDNTSILGRPFVIQPEIEIYDEYGNLVSGECQSITVKSMRTGLDIFQGRELGEVTVRGDKGITKFEQLSLSGNFSIPNVILEFRTGCCDPTNVDLCECKEKIARTDSLNSLTKEPANCVKIQSASFNLVPPFHHMELVSPTSPLPAVLMVSGESFSMSAEMKSITGSRVNSISDLLSISLFSRQCILKNTYLNSLNVITVNVSCEYRETGFPIGVCAGGPGKGRACTHKNTLICQSSSLRDTVNPPCENKVCLLSSCNTHKRAKVVNGMVSFQDIVITVASGESTRLGAHSSCNAALRFDTVGGTFVRPAERPN